jgi:hypothetical protein
MDGSHAANAGLGHVPSKTIKRTVQPCFVLQGNVCALLADHRPRSSYAVPPCPDPRSTMFV